MSEAEKHLEAKGITEATGFHSYGYLYKSTLEAMESYATYRLDSYKESLRSAIEEEISKYLNQISVLEVDEIGYSETASTYALIVNTLRTTLLLIDSVTPKE